MSHFAKVVDGLVMEVLVISQEEVNTGLFGDPSLFIQTSYNTRGGVHYGPDGQPDGPGLRKNYAGIGYFYDPLLDAFIPPKPYPSWLLDTQTCLWDSPVPYPMDGKNYVWDEDTLSWVESPPPEVAQAQSPETVPVVEEPVSVEPMLSTATSTVTQSTEGQ